ncbi:MAG: hypothetical protein J7599_07490 [Niabella sp.]|nr:hypothetical protein [Niabella sp.]
MALIDDQYYQLKVAYRSLLTGILSNGDTVKVYASFVPSGADPKKYILIGGNSSLDRPNKQVTLTQTTMQVDIFCKGESLIGNEHEDIGAQILQRLMPNPRFKIEGVQNFDISPGRLVSDIPIVTGGNTTMKVLERHFLIEHGVNHLKRQ